jgi:DNA-binding protein HU-beta
MSFRDGMLWVGQSYDAIQCASAKNCTLKGGQESKERESKRNIRKQICYVHEAEWRGCCRKVPYTPSWIVPGTSRIFLVHRDNLKSKSRGKIFGYYIVHRVELVKPARKITPYQIRHSKTRIVKNLKMMMEGTIYRADIGTPIKDASITFSPLGKSKSERAESDEHGNYKIKLHDGVYHILVEAKGYKPQNLLGVEVTPVEKTIIDFYLSPSKCKKDQALKKRFWDGSEIVTHRCMDGIWVETGEKCAEIDEESPECRDGQKIIQECWDGSTIISHKCEKGKWVATKRECPPFPEPKEKCKDGDLKQRKCKDGSYIITYRCKDAEWIPTYESCPKKPKCKDGEERFKECNDGTTIVTHICMDGKWVPTYNRCPQESPENDNNEEPDINDIENDNDKDPFDVPIDYTVFEDHRSCSLRFKPNAVYLVDALAAEITNTFKQRLDQSEIWNSYKNATSEDQRKQKIKEGNELFDEVVESIHARRVIKNRIPNSLQKLVNIRGELVLFKDPPILENHPQASFRGLRRINGDRLIRNIIQGVRIPRIEYYIKDDETETPRTKLINELVVKLHVNKSTAEKSLKEVIKFIEEELIENSTFVLKGFGSFSVVHRKKRKGRNPRTGEEILIPAKKVVKFKPSKALNDALIKEPGGNTGSGSL